jgi:aerobic-type carbon monoxide dehydrogenase small subunit (CoxS/CutS family)
LLTRAPLNDRLDLRLKMNPGKAPENNMPKEEEERETEEEKPKESFSTLSRRKFLKDAGLIAGGAVGGTMAGVSPITASVPAETGTAATTVPGPMVTAAAETAATGSQKIKLNVNGKEYEVQVDPEESLRDCLREKLGYLSIKDMCLGHGACGSCTVIMDGRPILSCMALAVECSGKKIETAEGIALSKHPLIETYIMNYCMQCGYCTPGFLCTAKALLDKNANPTEADIREALAGNLCRCATYLRHIPAVQLAARALKGA